MDVLYQSERSECGLVSLAMIASAHGLSYDMATLRARYQISLKGSTLAGLIGVAQNLKLETRAIRCEVDDLAHLRLPAVLHWRLDHFVVLAKVHGDKFVIHDPAVGEVLLSAREVSLNFTGVALEAWPGPTFEKADRRQRLRFEALLTRATGTVRAVAMVGILALGIEIITLLLPILQQLVIDDALITADTDLLQLLTIATGVFLVGQSATAAVRGIVQRNLSSSLSIILPTHVFRHMVSLPTTWFERRSAADVINRFESSNILHRTLTTSIVSAGTDGLMAFIALAMMAMYSLFLTGIVLLAFFAYGLVRVLWYRTYRQKSAGSLVQNAKVQSLMWETMRGISTIKLFNGTQQRQNQYLSALSQYVRLQNQIGTAKTAFDFAHDLLFSAERIAVVYLGAKEVLAANFSVGMLIAFMSFRENFVSKGTSLINTAVEFRMLGIHLDRLADILLAKPERKTELPFLGETSSHGLIEVKNVSFRYGDDEADILKHLSLRVEPNEIVAIVGPSGVGKSTLFKVLTGQVQPTSGTVHIDGLSLSVMGLERLRELIAVVRQDDTLFAGTIAENIALLDEHPDQVRIREAATKARIHDEIQRMPMGYNTLVGSMGSGLSGGQAQRLMLARALYRNPRILLLDEATSHLDVDNERSIALGLRDLGITQVIIAHRPETIAKADRVVDIRDINNLHDAGVIRFSPKEKQLRDI